MKRNALLLLIIRFNPMQAFNQLFESNRREVLNLLNHPLQLQLATGELPIGSFRRLLEDQKVILEGIKVAVGDIIDEELDFHEEASRQWLKKAEESGKTIQLEGINCYNCGEPHLNIDCPEDLESSQSAQALKSIIGSNGLVGAAAVLRCYSFSCDRLLTACTTITNDKIDPTYHGWLDAHAKRWSRLAEICEGNLELINASSSYSICISMLYNWIDGEASTTGIRGDLNDPLLSSLMDRLEELEPGYGAQRDKHSSFVADVTGKASSQMLQNKAEDQINAATKYLAKKKEKIAVEKAAAYLAAKKDERQKE
mmetsp:Transcript_9516/g.11756  ORF Transcript_9516/g.11756 Transcript_9516/m.11756 type:complete len:312 (-) Transcript_9516:395-1330(-)